MHPLSADVGGLSCARALDWRSPADPACHVLPHNPISSACTSKISWPPDRNRGPLCLKRYLTYRRPWYLSGFCAAKWRSSIKQTAGTARWSISSCNFAHAMIAPGDLWPQDVLPPRKGLGVMDIPRWQTESRGTRFRPRARGNLIVGGQRTRNLSVWCNRSVGMLTIAATIGLCTSFRLRRPFPQVRPQH